MEFMMAFPLLLLPLALPVIAGLMAKSFGRKYWFWFIIGVPLPIIAQIILLCLPDLSKERHTAVLQ